MFLIKSFQCDETWETFGTTSTNESLAVSSSELTWASSFLPAINSLVSGSVKIATFSLMSLFSAYTGTRAHTRPQAELIYI